MVKTKNEVKRKNRPEGLLIEATTGCKTARETAEALVANGFIVDLQHKITLLKLTKKASKKRKT